MGRWSRWRLRGSVLTYLLVLSLVPMTGLTAFAGILTRQAQDHAMVVERVRAGMSRVQALDRLCLAMTQESTSSAATRIASALGITLPALESFAGLSLTPVAQARRETDAALRPLLGDPELAGVLGSVRGQLAQMRSIPLPAKRNTTIASAARYITPVVTLANGLSQTAGSAEIAAAQTVSSGRLGAPSASVLQAATQLTAIVQLVVEGYHFIQTLYVASETAAGPDSSEISELREANSTFQVLTELVSPSLRGDLATDWQELANSSTAQQIEALAASRLGSPAGDRASAAGLNTVGVVVQAGRLSVTFNDQLDSLLTRAVNQGVAAARGEESRTRRQAHIVVLSSIALVVFTLGLLVLLGGLLRQRLILLAGAAHRLSGGHLEVVDLPGPRELELAGQGLNDAARSLERTIAGADRLAAGDLTATELSVPLDGQLGAVVHRAFAKVLDAIEERERLQQELAHQASHDPLTGLLNRGAAEMILDLVVESPGGNQPDAVLFIDLDHFKAVNDTYGHGAGDHVLQVAAARMAAQLRKDDTLCRLGGDEFLIVMRGTRAEVAVVANKIVAVIEESIPWQGHDLRIGASVGVAAWEPTITTADELLTRADHAVYESKAKGRGNVTFWNQDARRDLESSVPAPRYDGSPTA